MRSMVQEKRPATAVYLLVCISEELNKLIEKAKYIWKWWEVLIQMWQDIASYYLACLVCSLPVSLHLPLVHQLTARIWVKHCPHTYSTYNSFSYEQPYKMDDKTTLCLKKSMPSFLRKIKSALFLFFIINMWASKAYYYNNYSYYEIL